MELFQGIKKEYGVLVVQSKPAGADVYINDSKDPAGITPLTIGCKAGSAKIRVKKGKKEKKEILRVIGGEKITSPIYILKGGSSLLLVLGGLALAGGAGAALLLKGKPGEEGGAPTTGIIQVNSSPTGSSVYLDGNDTGKTTNCTLTFVSPGSHTVKLIKEGYEDYQESVSVTAGQTSTVNANLTKHTVTVTSPTSSTVWTKGDEVEIRWETSGSENSQGNVSPSTGLNPLSYPGRNLSPSFQRRAFRHNPAFRGLMRTRRGLESMDSSKNRQIILNDSSKFQDASKKLSSHAKEGNIIHQRAKNIGVIEKNKGFSSINLLLSPGTSFISSRHLPQALERSGDIKALTLTNVKIELYKGINLVQTIASSTENDGSYSWTVDLSLLDGTDYKVRISCVSDSSIYDESDEFRIEEKSITVIEPTSSTVWTKRHSADIAWTFEGTINNVKIDLYKGIILKATIVTSTENDGSYTWTEVDPSLADGSDYKVKVSCVSETGVYGESDEFMIEEKSITVTEPTSSTIWSPGDSVDIIWTSNGTISDVKIDLYKGGTFNQTIVSSTENDGAYSWTEVDTSLTFGSDYKVRISCVSDSSIYGESDEFRIEGKTITVTEPSSSTIWTKGFSADITWSYIGAINDVRIDLYKGTTLKETIVSSSENDRLYTWTEVNPFLEDGSDYKVMVSCVSDLRIYGESDEFTIEEKAITVTEPTSSTIWSQGDSAEITWTSTGAINNVKIDLYKGITLNQTIALSTENDGTYTWPEVDPFLADGADYKVKISWTSDSGVYDESDEFMIEEKSITVTEPTSSTIWVTGDSADITWTSTGAISNVKIDLYKGITLKQTISESTENDGSYTWTVDPSLTNGTDYKVRISCVIDSGVYDESDEFEITHGYAFMTKWGSHGSGDGQFDTLWGIAVDSSGYVYVGDRWNHRIQKFTSNGTFEHKWGSEGSGDGQLSSPVGVAVDGAGYVYVADQQNHRIQKFTSYGTFVTKWGSHGSGDGQLSSPVGVAVDSSGYVYVADSNNHRVQKFTSDGTFIAIWGSEGSGDGQFNHPIGIAADEAGYVYVADQQNHRIQKFTSNGTFVTKWGSYDSGDGQLNAPEGIAVDSSGCVYVADTLNHRIQKFKSNGTFVNKWGNDGGQEGQVSYPQGIAVDSSGCVYVADGGGNCIQKFGPISAIQNAAKLTYSPLNKHFTNRKLRPRPGFLNLPELGRLEKKQELMNKKVIWKKKKDGK